MIGKEEFDRLRSQREEKSRKTGLILGEAFDYFNVMAERLRRQSEFGQSDETEWTKHWSSGLTEYEPW